MSEEHDQRRPWPWKRIMAGVVALIIGITFVAHLIWTAKERGVVTRRVAALRAAGGPMEVKDFVFTPVPSDQDAGPLILAAAAALVEDRDRDGRLRELSDDAFDPPLSDATLAIAREVLAANAAALAIIAPVDTRTDADFGVRMVSPSIRIMLPGLNKARGVADVLQTQARVAHHDGNGLSTIEALIDIDAIGSVMHKNPGIVGALVGMGICTMSADTALTLAPDLPIDDGVTRDRVRVLIGRYLNDQIPCDAYERALLDERFFAYDTAEGLVNGTLTLSQLGLRGTAATSGAANSILMYALRPIVIRGEWQTLDVNTEELRLNRLANDYAAYQAASGPIQAMRLRALSSPLPNVGTIMMSDLSRATLTRFRTTTDRHLAAVALAIRLYTIDHAGSLPPTLDALVPGYLPRVPDDAIDGKAIRYDSVRKIIWSVGDNGTDENGDATPPRPTWTDRWRTRDAVLHLERRPKPATAPAATEDDQ